VSYTYAAAITEARDRHASFTEQRHPSAAALRFLATYGMELHGKMLNIDPEADLSVQETALPLPDFAAGLALPLRIRGISHIIGVGFGGEFPITLIPPDVRFTFREGYPSGGAAWRIENTLYLRGSELNWRGVEAIRVWYWPTAPNPLARPEDAALWESEIVPLPDITRRAMVEALAAFFARRSHADDTLPAVALAAFETTARNAEQAFLDDLGHRRGAIRFVTQDTRPS